MSSVFDLLEKIKQTKDNKTSGCSDSLTPNNFGVDKNSLFCNYSLNEENEALFGNGKFPKLCSFSPDGLCLALSSEDNKLYVFEPSVAENSAEKKKSIKPVLELSQGGQIFDFAWHPHLSSSNGENCFILVCSNATPIHALDAFDGKIAHSFLSFDDADEVSHAYSLMFSPSGRSFYAGLYGQVARFDLSRPGAKSEQIDLGRIKKRRAVNSTLDVVKEKSNLLAVGDYSGGISLIDLNGGGLAMSFEDSSQKLGINQVKMTENGENLLVSSRKSKNIVLWDLRNSSEPVTFFEVASPLTGKLKTRFAVDNNRLCAGDKNGQVLMYALDSTEKNAAPVDKLKTESRLPINCVALNSLNDDLAVTTGERQFSKLNGDLGENERALLTEKNERSINRVMIYRNKLK